MAIPPTLADMITPKKVQLAYFFAPNTTFRSITMAAEVDKVLSGLFAGDPLVLPLPSDPPMDYPRIVWQDDSAGQILVSQIRADFHLRLGKHTAEDFVSLCKKLTRIFVNDLSIGVVRIGIVVTADLNNEAGVDYITSQYFHAGKVSGSREAVFGWLRRFELEGYALNRWVRFELGSVEHTISVDTNTIPEVALQLDAVKIERLVSSVLKEIWGDWNAVAEWQLDG